MLVGARHATVTALALVATAAGAFSVGAEIDGTAFTSEANNVRMTVPRGWRNNDQSSYPGVLLRMYKTNPGGTMLLAVDDLPEKIDPTCVARQTTTGEGVVVEEELPLPLQIACDQSRRLKTFGFEVGTIKEAARPTFDYASGTRALRQGVAVIEDRVFTLVLSASTPEARAQHTRTFEKSLLSLRALTASERAAARGDDVSDAGLDDAGVPDDGRVPGTDDDRVPGTDGGVAPDAGPRR